MSFNPDNVQLYFACIFIDNLKLPSSLKQVVLSNSVPDFFSKKYNDISLKKYILDYQEKTGNFVYFVLATEVDSYTHYSFLYVTKYKDANYRLLKCSTSGDYAMVEARVYFYQHDDYCYPVTILVKKFGGWLYMVD